MTLHPDIITILQDVVRGALGMALLAVLVSAVCLFAAAVLAARKD